KGPAGELRALLSDQLLPGRGWARHPRSRQTWVGRARATWCGEYCPRCLLGRHGAGQLALFRVLLPTVVLHRLGIELRRGLSRALWSPARQPVRQLGELL